jgi:hypothetical protein
MTTGSEMNDMAMQIAVTGRYALNGAVLHLDLDGLYDLAAFVDAALDLDGAEELRGADFATALCRRLNQLVNDDYREQSAAHGTHSTRIAMDRAAKDLADKEAGPSTS